MHSTIKQYRPAFVTGLENETNTFSSLEELLNIPWVKSIRKDPIDELKCDLSFYRYSIATDDHRIDYVLMAEFEEGYSWYVLGFIDKIDHIKDLPEWKPKYKEKETNN